MKKFLSLCIFFCSLVLFGCSSITIPAEDGEKTTIDLGSLKDGDLDVSVEGSDGEEGSFSINTDEDGQATFSGSDGESEFISQTGNNVSLPEDFPSNFPLPDNHQVISVQTITENGNKVHNVSFTFEQDVETIFNIYKEYAESQGYTINQELKSSEMHMLITSSEDGSEGFNLTILSDEAEQMGSIMVKIP